MQALAVQAPVISNGNTRFMMKMNQLQRELKEYTEDGDWASVAEVKKDIKNLLSRYAEKA